MRNSSLILWIVLLGLSPIHPAKSAVASDLRLTPTVRAIQRTIGSVVNIHGRKTVRDELSAGRGDNLRLVNGMGAGVIIDERGYVLTNYHVVEGVSRIQVTLNDKRTVVAKLIDFDLPTDLAVIRIPSEGDLEPIQVGTSSDLMLGETVIAIGNPYGYSGSASEGIISALNRDVPVNDNQRYDNVIQTNADINPGNSGGPLVNIDGEMIGINAAVRVGAQGIAFTIPVDDAMAIAAKLLSAEKVSGVSHGLVGRDNPSSDGSRFIVQNVAAGGTADRGGVLAGDVITHVGDFPVHRRLDFERAIIGRAEGDQIEVSVERDGEQLTLDMELDAVTRGSTAVATKVWSKLGLRLTPISKSAFRNYKTGYRGGMKVVAVRPRSPSADQGIRPGDILIGMLRWETINMDNVAFILNSDEFRGQEPIKFFILRDNEPLYGHMRLASGR